MIDCLRRVCVDIIYFLKRTIELSCTFMPCAYCPHEAQDKGSSHPSLVPQGRHTLAVLHRSQDKVVWSVV